MGLVMKKKWQINVSYFLIIETASNLSSSSLAIG